MSDEERRARAADDADDAGDAVARRLTALGPLVPWQERAEATEPDPAFVRRLHAHLVGETARAADPPGDRAARPVFAETGGGAGHPLPAPGRRRGPGHLSPWALLAAALVAALLALVMLVRPPRGGRGLAPTVAAALPRPSGADLTRGFPLLGGGGAGAPPSPVISSLEEGNNPPYPGRLHLTAGALPRGAPALRAYRLGAPDAGAARVARLARLLGIDAAVTTRNGGNAPWTVAATAGVSAAGPTLHSVAVSTATGEVVYHDVRGVGAPRGAQGRAVAVAAARAWLTRVGWPGSGLPVQSALNGGTYAPGEWTIAFGWAGTGPAATSAASVVVEPGARVGEARLWPRADRSYTVPARGIDAAWAELRQGRMPLAVTTPGAPGQFMVVPGAGQGRVTGVTVAQVLTAGDDGRLYLVPAYRFAGTTRVRVRPLGVAASRPLLVDATWYTLIPAARP